MHQPRSTERPRSWHVSLAAVVGLRAALRGWVGSATFTATIHSCRALEGGPARSCQGDREVRPGLSVLHTQAGGRRGYTEKTRQRPTETNCKDSAGKQKTKTRPLGAFGEHRVPITLDRRIPRTGPGSGPAQKHRKEDRAGRNQQRRHRKRPKDAGVLLLQNKCLNLTSYLCALLPSTRVTS